MAVFALWSAPRARSTAFFRSMAERGDMTLLHEPFSNLRDYGQTDVDGRVFHSPASLLAWLRGEKGNVNVFLKDTADHPLDEVLADRRFLAGTRHAFLIRRPEEIAASYYALFPPMTINAIGMERLCGLQAAVRGRLPGSKVNGPSGAGPRAGTPTPAPVPASNNASGRTSTPSKTPAS